MMKTKPAASTEGWYASSERTSQTDDQRIVDVTPLPPPEHLIRFFPIAGTPVETLIGKTRATIRRIMQREDDRLLVIIGPVLDPRPGRGGRVRAPAEGASASATPTRSRS